MKYKILYFIKKKVNEIMDKKIIIIAGIAILAI